MPQTQQRSTAQTQTSEPMSAEMSDPIQTIRKALTLAASRAFPTTKDSETIRAGLAALEIVEATLVRDRRIEAANEQVTA